MMKEERAKTYSDVLTSKLVKALKNKIHSEEK